jgi:hypothetical protein
LLWGFSSYVSLLVNLFNNFSPFSYGLAGAVISGDRERCQRLAEVWLSEGLKHYFIGVAWSLHPCSKLSFLHLCSLHNIDSFLYYSSWVRFIQLLGLFFCFFFNNCMTPIPTTGDQRRMYLGKLLATLLLPSSLGWEQAQRLWTWARRRVSRAWWSCSQGITVNDLYLTPCLWFAGASITTWASSR